MDPAERGRSGGAAWVWRLVFRVIGPGTPQRGACRAPPHEGEGGWAVWPGRDAKGEAFDGVLGCGVGAHG